MDVSFYVSFESSELLVLSLSCFGINSFWGLMFSSCNSAWNWVIYNENKFLNGSESWEVQGWGEVAGEDLCVASSHSGRMKGQGHMRAIL